MSKKPKASKPVRKQQATRRKSTGHVTWPNMKSFPRVPEVPPGEFNRTSLAAVHSTSTILHQALKRLADK